MRRLAFRPACPERPSHPDARAAHHPNTPAPTQYGTAVPQVVVQDEAQFEMASDVCGILLQYPATDGSIHNYRVRCAA